MNGGLPAPRHGQQVARNRERLSAGGTNLDAGQLRSSLSTRHHPLYKARTGLAAEHRETGQRVRARVDDRRHRDARIGEGILLSINAIATALRNSG